MKGATTRTTGESMTMRSLPTGSAADESSALCPGMPTSPHSSAPVGGLQMANEFTHQPVLLNEVIEIFSSVPAGIVVDATLGGAGHAMALLEARSDISLIGIDRDPVARAAAAERLSRFNGRAVVVAGNFGDIKDVVARERTLFNDAPIVGVLADLGVSSPQLDDPDRGFSFRANAPLDMRMDPSDPLTAADLIEKMPEADLARLLHHHGETRFARSIARSLKTRHPSTTTELSEAVEAVVPMAARRRGHVATRVFQALRVEVNDEEGELDRLLSAAMTLLVADGALAVISYHSGEDRVVKDFLREEATGGCRCPVELGCVCGATSRVRVLKASAVLANASELARNPRARSARLRAAWKVAS